MLRLECGDPQLPDRLKARTCPRTPEIDQLAAVIVRLHRSTISFACSGARTSINSANHHVRIGA